MIPDLKLCKNKPQAWVSYYANECTAIELHGRRKIWKSVGASSNDFIMIPDLKLCKNKAQA